MNWLKQLFTRRRIYTDLSAEMQQHLDEKIEELVATGMPRKVATATARRQFGNLTLLENDSREVWQWPSIESFLADVQYASRMLRKNTGFTCIAILTLALGIGANTAVFSLVNSILLKPLAYPNPDRIVMPELISPPGVNLGSEYFPWGHTQYRFLTRDNHPFEAIGAFQSDSFNLTGAGEPTLLDGFRVSAEFFPALGVAPALGRAFTSEEDQPGHEQVVVLSDRLWRERFSADPNLLGHALALNGASYTVVGVMPPGFVFPRAEEMPSTFNFPKESQLWVPLAVGEVAKSGPSETAVVARLKPNMTIPQAQAVIDLVTKHAELKDPRWKGWFNVRIVPLTQQVVGDTRRPLQLMLGAVCIVLLIACSNVANLLLTRSLGRRREFTLRAALGAGRYRLIRQLLTESLLLSFSAGILGVFIAWLGVYFVATLGPSNIPRLREVSLDLPVLGFALLISLVTGLLFGLAPALGTTRDNIADSLKEGNQRSGSSPSHPRLRNALLVSQVAMALVLVVSAGLLTRTFFRMLGTNGGFNPDRVLTFQVPLPALKYTDQNHIVMFFRNVLPRLRAMPGIESAGIGEIVPMGGEGESTGIRMPDHPAANQKVLAFANYTIISPGYLSATGTPVLRGRDIQESDTADSLPVAIINAAMEKRYWPGQSAIGKQVAPASERYPLCTIVGVVPDIKHSSLREQTAPEMYVAYTQKPWPSMLNMHVVLRTKADPSSFTAGVREAVHSFDPDLPVANVTTLTTMVDNSLSQPRFSMLLLASFGILALLLASIGMYGVISYSVMQRTQEIGIRMALGAEQGRVFRMILTQGARLAGLGIAIGLVAALGITRLIAGFLFGVQPTDPPTFIAVSLLLVATALLACYLPARRATRVDPIVALRYE